MNFNRFSDQVAIVTGGADGLGKAMVDRLVGEGATVCIFDFNDSTREATVAEFAERGCSVVGTAVDVGDEASVRHAIAEVVDAHGRLDVMINCAGIVGQTNVKAVEYDIDVFDQVIKVNLRGSFLMAKHCLPPTARFTFSVVILGRQNGTIAGRR